MNKIANYAISLVAEGAEGCAEDDLGESEEAESLTHKQQSEGADLGVKMAQAIGQHRDSFLAWYRSVDPTALADG